MKNWKNLLAATAFVLAVGGAYATSFVTLVPAFQKIKSPFRIGVTPTECQFVKNCETINTGLVCQSAGGIQLFGDDGAGKCLRVLYEP